VAGADQRSLLPLDHLDRWTAWWRTTYRGRMRGREVGTFPVGRFPGGTSPWGALDMAGNVFEWVDADFEPYPGSPFDHPEFGQGLRVVRGGDWYLGRIYHRASARSRAPADHRVPTSGFRCACDTPADRHVPVEAR
jgi:formylglycine-generating enzyme required for sulfatase activity